jgi:hypothetical protein
MIKRVLMVAAVFAAGSMGLVWADSAPAVGNDAGHMSTKEMGHVRIVTLKDRIKNQRQRIAKDLASKGLTADQATACDALLDNMVSQMKAERKADGPKKIMTKDNYDAYNTTLDDNSALIHEGKQYFYYYGPYADYGPDYSYYYDAYSDTAVPTPSVSAKEMANPRIFELKDRIKNQRARIAQGLSNNTLTADDAKNCGATLDSVAEQMKADYKADGSMEMTKDQYTAFNTSLDSNSITLHEAKQYFYYYNEPNYGQYYWD